MTQGRTNLEPSQSTPVGEASGQGEGEGPAGRQAWSPPTTPVRAGKVGKEPIVQHCEAGPVEGHCQEDPSGQGGVRAFTQAINGLFLSFQIESTANRFLQAGRQKGEAWRCLETQVQEAKGLYDLSHGCRNPRPGPPCQGSPRMPFVTSQVLTGVGVGVIESPWGSALKWFKRKNAEGTSLAVQGLRLHTSTAGTQV